MLISSGRDLEQQQQQHNINKIVLSTLNRYVLRIDIHITDKCLECVQIDSRRIYSYIKVNSMTRRIAEVILIEVRESSAASNMFRGDVIVLAELITH